MSSYISITDQFCGAGGSSIGASQVDGTEIVYGLNHWKLAVQTHETNFPHAAHDCRDISATDPRDYKSTTILITSPECTNHSLAKGAIRKRQQRLLDLSPKKRIEAMTEADRSRATMWDVPRFAECHKYKFVIVENVVDARKWVQWPAWILAMDLLGYHHKVVYLNSMFVHPTPQSRDRLYVVFWKKGNPVPDLEIRPEAHCQSCLKKVASVQSWKNPNKAYGKWGRYKKQYLYRCPHCANVVTPYYYSAFNIIDWTLKAKMIKDRPRPLSSKTMRRIQYGIDKFGKQPLVITTKYSSGTATRVRTVAGDPLPTQPGEGAHSLVHPFIVDTAYASGHRTTQLDQPLTTQTTRQTTGIVQADMTPFLTEQWGTSTARGISEPISTITTTEHHALITTESAEAFFAYYYGGSNVASHITQPLNTVTTNDRVGLVIPTSTPIYIGDCIYRTIKSHEVGLAMAFEKTYIVLGNQKQKVKQYGNAVNPPVMKLLVQRCADTLQ